MNLFTLFKTGEISDFRLRRTFFTGKLVVQIKRVRYRSVGTPMSWGSAGPCWVKDGFTDWKDASGNDSTENAEVLCFLRNLKG